MSLNTSFKLDKCFVDPNEHVLEITDGERKILQPKFIEVLAYLAHHYPRIVERQELIDEIWDGNHYVGEKSLNNAIWNLRNELKQTGDDYIETVRKKGYRLLVKPVYLKIESDTKVKPKSKPLWRRKGVNLGIFVASILLVMLSIFITFLFSPQTQEHIITTLTHEPGREVYPAVSPDNTHLIYSWRRIGQQPNLFIKNLTDPSEPAKQLTFSKFYEGRTVWHPNGELIYFQRKNWRYSKCDIVQLNVVTLEQRVVTECFGELDFALDISPDGRFLAYPYVSEGADTAQAHLFDLRTGEEVGPIKECDVKCNYRDLDVAYSPDGKKIALARTMDEGLNEQLYIYDVISKQFTQLTDSEGDIKGMSWHKSGQKLLYSTSAFGKRDGYLIDLKNQQRTKLELPGFSYPKFIPGTNDVIYHQWQSSLQLASVNLQEGVPTAPFPLMQSDYSYHSPHYSVATNRLVYVSNESGYKELWTSNADGSDRQKLTSLRSNLNFPRWSHNGKYVAFLGPKNRKGKNALYVVNVESKVVKKVDSPFDRHYRPSWLRDDSAVIAGARHQRKRALYAFPLDNSEIVTLLPKRVKFAVQDESGDIWFSPGRNRGLWKIAHLQHNSFAEPVKVLQEDKFRVSYNWDIDESGVYFQHDFLNHVHIEHFNNQTEQLTSIFKLPTGTIERASSITILPTLNKLVFTQNEFPKVDIKRLQHPLFN